MVLMVEKSSEEMKPILNSNGPTGTYEPDLKIGDAYKHITMSIQADPLKTEKPELTLQLFSAAIKMQSEPLAKECADILNRQLNKRNVLLIMRHIYDCNKTTCPPPDPLDVAPSAPPILEHDSQFSKEWVRGLRDNLRNNCLLEIDKNADFVLKQNEILDMSYRDVLAITSRDTLQVSDELLVYSAVMRWAMEECKRRTLEPHLNILKGVLQELIRGPRYGLMSKKDFCCKTIDGVRGPRRSGILQEKEVEVILGYIKKKAKNRTVEEQLPHKGSLPRKSNNEKSSALHSGISGDSTCSTTSPCDKFVINFLTCWTAVFD